MKTIVKENKNKRESTEDILISHGLVTKQQVAQRKEQVAQRKAMRYRK